MCQFMIENQGIQTFLTYDLHIGEEVDQANYDLIHDKQLSGILPTFLSYSTLEEQKTEGIKFNISARVTMREFFQKGAARKELLPVLHQIAETLMTCGQYTLDLNCLFLDVQYIYLNPETREPELLYLPIIKGKEEADIPKKLKDIILSLKYDISENATYISEITKFLEKNESFTLSGFLELLDEKMKDVPELMHLYQEGRIKMPVMNLAQSEQPEPAQEDWTGPKMVNAVDNVGKAQAKDNEVTENESKDNMSGSGTLNVSTLESSLLNSSTKAYLKRVKTEEKVYISKRLFKIGKEKQFVDYCIMDNPAISRSHANIVMENEEYYIMDMNSKNRTFVNGQIISGMKKVKLVHGSYIQLADEFFEFYLET